MAWPPGLHAGPDDHATAAAHVRDGSNPDCGKPILQHRTEAAHLLKERIEHGDLTFADHDPCRKTPWNKGKFTGAKPPLQPKHVWAIRTRLQIASRTRDLAL